MDAVGIATHVIAAMVGGTVGVFALAILQAGKDKRMDEALPKSGQWPNVAVKAGSDPKEVMKRYGVKSPFESVFDDEPIWEPAYAYVTPVMVSNRQILDAIERVRKEKNNG